MDCDKAIEKFLEDYENGDQKTRDGIGQEVNEMLGMCHHLLNRFKEIDEEE